MNISVFLLTAKDIADVFGKIIILAPDENIAFETLKNVRLLNNEINNIDYDVMNLLTFCSFKGSIEDWRKETYNKIITISNNISTENIIFFIKNIYDIQSNFVYKIYEYYEDKENRYNIYLYDKNNVPYISVIKDGFMNSTNIPFSLSDIMNDYSRLKKENERLKNKLK